MVANIGLNYVYTIAGGIAGRRGATTPAAIQAFGGVGLLPTHGRGMADTAMHGAAADWRGYRSWGMTMLRSVHARHDERTRPLPGDEIITPAIGSLTHAITIRRPSYEVWPWLVQMGAGRAGWYSYDLIDNGGHRSAERIVPELQHPTVGEIFPAIPGEKKGFTLLCCEAARYLVLGWRPSPDAAPIMTWAFVLEEPASRTTRLIVRARVDAGYQPPFDLPSWTISSLVPAGHYFMQRKQLLGIARRAEGRRSIASRSSAL